MKLTKKILNEHGIHNSYDIAQKAGNKLFLSYNPAETGLASRSPQWVVQGIGIYTDPKSHWRDYGSKMFTVYGRQDKKPKFNEAIKWVKDKFDIDITDKDPFGGYHPKGTLDKLKALIKADKE